MRILVIEDEHKTAEYLRKGLSEQGYSVEVAHNGEDGLHLAETGGYEAIILDGMLPRLDGVVVLERLRRNHATPVIMLTARDAVEDRLRGLGAGADDYLVKPFSFLELLARLHNVTRRNHVEQSVGVTIADLHVDLIGRRAMRGGRPLNLTAKEYGVLAVLARRRGQIVSKTILMESVWGINFDTDTNIVEVTVKRLRAKLDQVGQSRLLHTLRGMGYVLEDQNGQPT